MDPNRVLNVFTIFGILGIIAVLSSVRRSWIRVEYSVSWLLAAVILCVLGLWKSLDEWLAVVLGVDSFALVLLMLMSVVFVIVLYRLSLIISGLRDSNIKLTQRVAILEYRLESLDE